MSDSIKLYLLAVLVVVIVALGSFGLTALIVKGICWAFGFTFTYKIAFGVWLIILLIGQFTVRVKAEK